MLQAETVTSDRQQYTRSRQRIVLRESVWPVYSDRNALVEESTAPVVSPRGIDRRHDLDALRAFAMLLGIGLHAALSFVPFPWVVQDTQQNQFFGLFFVVIHGFRMPLFFVVSGFFTAMLWRRRGLKALVQHRAKRILLPCLIGLLTVIPAMEWVTRQAIPAGSDVELQGDESIHSAVRVGDLDAVRRHLDEIVDVNEQDTEFGVTPLSWAAMHGHIEIMRELLDHNAKVDAPNRDGATALHSAAFLGESEAVAVLIEHDVDLTSRTLAGQTANEVLNSDEGTTRFIAGLLKVPCDYDAVRAGRAAVRRMLNRDEEADEAEQQPQPGDASDSRSAYRSLITSDGLAVRWPWSSETDEPFHLVTTPVFHHLWFLWFLCWMVPGFAIYAKVAGTIKLKRLPDWLIVSPLRLLWLFPLTMLPQWFMGVFAPTFGPDTSVGLIPQPHLLAYYGVFFGFGALYFDCDDMDGRLGRWWWLSLPIGLLIALPIGIATLSAHPVTSVAQVVYVWAMTFGMIGLFRATLSTQSPLLRYLSDSSYWLYVAHLPLVIAAQAFVREWSLPASLKFLLVCTVVTGFLLATYHTLVRYTWLGTLLNGPRKRPISVSDDVPAMTDTA